MPLGEFVGDVRFEVPRDYPPTVAYYTGVIVLGVLTLGRLQTTPLHTLQE